MKIQLTESQLHNVIRRCINQMINEEVGGEEYGEAYNDNDEYDGIGDDDMVFLGTTPEEAAARLNRM